MVRNSERILNLLEGKWRREQCESNHGSFNAVHSACRRRGRWRQRSNDSDIGGGGGGGGRLSERQLEQN